MSNKIYVKPAKGRNVRDPKTRKHLPEAGAWVERSGYWIKRQADGDVLEAKPPQPPKTTKATKATSAE